jgi:rfaE bifunctional protein kinase chain/domain
MLTGQRAESILNCFSDQHALVIGDVMLDAYIFGKVDRISPEAPVPVVNLKHTENRLGGAANVALNLVSLGASATICSLVGDDAEGKIISALFTERNIAVDGLVHAPGRPTTVKTRIMGNNHQLLRIDREETSEPNGDDEKLYIARILSLIDRATVVIFSDYEKGALTVNVIRQVTEACIAKGIPTVVDPKKRHFQDYKGVTLFKPNLKELAEGLKCPPVAPEKESLIAGMQDLHGILEHRYSMVTLSEFGMVLYDHSLQEYSHQPAHIRNISDVSGAGDTVVSVASLCLASGVSASELLYMSNLAGGLVCEQVGVVPVTREMLLQEF